MNVDDKLKQQLDDFRKDFHGLRSEISKVIVGQHEILDDTLISLIAGILILIVPRLLNYIVAVYLIVIGAVGLFGK